MSRLCVCMRICNIHIQNNDIFVCVRMYLCYVYVMYTHTHIYMYIYIVHTYTHTYIYICKHFRVFRRKGDASRFQ